MLGWGTEIDSEQEEIGSDSSFNRITVTALFETGCTGNRHHRSPDCELVTEWPTRSHTRKVWSHTQFSSRAYSLRLLLLGVCRPVGDGEKARLYPCPHPNEQKKGPPWSKRPAESRHWWWKCMDIILLSPWAGPSAAAPAEDSPAPQPGVNDPVFPSDGFTPWLDCTSLSFGKSPQEWYNSRNNRSMKSLQKIVITICQALD